MATTAPAPTLQEKLSDVVRGRAAIPTQLLDALDAFDRLSPDDQRLFRGWLSNKK